MGKTAKEAAQQTTKKTDDTQDEVIEISDETRDYLLSDAGLARIMRGLSDSYENWRDCPVKRCRRARRCQGPDMVCQLKEPQLIAPPEEIADVNARMRQIALRRLERLGVW